VKTVLFVGLAYAAAAPVPAPKDDPAAFAAAPKMRVGRDLPIRNVWGVAWSPDGKRLALQGTDDPPPAPDPGAKGGPKGGPAGMAAPKRTGNLVYVVEFNDTGVERAGRGAASLPAVATLVGFTPAGNELVTDQREYGLVSGFHQLHYYTFDVNDPDGKPVAPGLLGSRLFARKRATVDLDATDTHGYHFAADGKTFRTVATERDGTGAAAKLDVREVDAVTGKTLKSLLKVDHALHVLSPDGLRLAVLEKNAKVVVYDTGRGAKVSEYALPEPPAPAPQVKGQRGVGGGWGERVEREPATYLRFSPDRRLLVVARHSHGTNPAGEPTVGHTAVLDADTGKPLPPLDGADLMRVVPGRHAFSGDGRLLAMAGDRYAANRIGVGPNGPWQTELSSRGSFLTVWDTRTGKPLKSWDRGGSTTVAFHPTKPLLAVLEPNGEETRLGVWDFAAEAPKK
jgi:hypothetical protein